MWSFAGAGDNRAAKARTSSPAGSVGTLKPCLRAFRADLCFPVREMGPVLTLELLRLAAICFSLISGRLQRARERRLFSSRNGAARPYPTRCLSESLIPPHVCRSFQRRPYALA